MLQVIRPFQDTASEWLGLDVDGQRRKIFKVVDGSVRNSDFLTSGLTIFEPGESSSLHHHPDSEEINFIVRGSGEVVDEAGEKTPFGPHSFMFIPKGEKHQHVNTGEEPLWLVFVYGPHGRLPVT